MSDSLTIAAFQQNIIWEDPSANRIAIGDAIPFKKGAVDLLILPEMFTTGFTMNAQAEAETMDGATIQWMKSISSKLECSTCGSLIIEEEGHFYNRLIWVSSEGMIWYYDKKYLFTLAKEDETYTAGQEHLLVELKGWKVLPLICYDLRFPEWGRNTMAYDLLIYVANFPAKRAYAWKQLLIARAIENESYVIGVNRSGKDALDIEYSGDSMVVNYQGDVQAQARKSNDWIIHTLYKEPQEAFRRAYPFLKDIQK